MGYRMHQRTKSLINYDEGIGNWQIDEWAEFFKEIDPDAVVYDENGYTLDTWEISKNAIKNEIKVLKTINNKQDILFADWTIEEICSTLERFVNLNEKNEKNLDFPDIIILDWF